MPTISPATTSFAAASILLHLALLIPPTTLSHSQLATIFLPVIWSCHIYTWSCGLGVFSAVHALWSTDLLLFRRPREDFCLVHKKQGDAVAACKSNAEDTVWLEPYPDDLAARFWWVFKLVASTRFVGWDTRETGKLTSRAAESHGYSKRQWFLRKSLTIVLCFLVLDAFNAYQLHDPYFNGLADIDSPLPRNIFSVFGRYLARAIPPRALRLMVFGIQQYSVFTIISTLMAITSGVLGLLGLLDDFWGSLDNMPPIWGSPLVVLQSGLRGFWGKFWHQLFRHMFADPGKALARQLNVRTRSSTAYGIQIAVAFFLSGALHAATLPVNIPDLSPFRYAAFFWLNGICVLVELFASRTFKLIAPNDQPMLKISLMVVRLVWTTTILYFTGPLLMNETTKLSLRMSRPPVLLFPARRS